MTSYKSCRIKKILFSKILGNRYSSDGWCKCVSLFNFQALGTKHVLHAEESNEDVSSNEDSETSDSPDKTFQVRSN